MPNPMLSNISAEELSVGVHAYRHYLVDDPEQRDGHQDTPRHQAHARQGLHAEKVPTATYR